MHADVKQCKQTVVHWDTNTITQIVFLLFIFCPNIHLKPPKAINKMYQYKNYANLLYLYQYFQMIPGSQTTTYVVMKGMVYYKWC